MTNVPPTSSPRLLAPFRGKPFRRLQREWCQRWYHYPHRNLLIVGQPKSGSTWLFNMVKEIPGYFPWTPDYIKFEQHHLQETWATRTPAGYTVTKLHTPPSPENIKIIRRTGRPYAVLIRDLRDIAVSWCFYVGNEVHHPRHAAIQPLELKDRLDYFIREMLPTFAAWSTGWQEGIDAEQGRLVRYEAMLADPAGELGRVLDHFGVELNGEEVRAITDQFDFARQTGRRAGHEDTSQFNRKGIAGDWVNHFSETHRRAFKAIAGEALITLGYAVDQGW